MIDHKEIVENALILYLSGMVDSSGEVLCDFIPEAKISVKFIDPPEHYTMTFYMGQNKSQTIEFRSGVRIGLTRYYDNGFRKSEEFFVNNLREGKYTEWYDTGDLKLEGQYVAGKQEGEQKTYKDFKVIDIRRFSSDKKVSGNTVKEEPDVQPKTASYSNKSILHKYYTWEDNKTIKQKEIHFPTEPKKKLYLFFSRAGDLIAKRTFENGVKIDEWGQNVVWENEKDMFK